MEEARRIMQYASLHGSCVGRDLLRGAVQVARDDNGEVISLRDAFQEVFSIHRPFLPSRQLGKSRAAVLRRSSSRCQEDPSVVVCNRREEHVIVAIIEE